MLAIPTVKSLGGLGDTSSMLTTLVNQNMCPEEVVRNDIANLEQCRAAATSVTEPSESGQQHLLRYAQQLRSFAPRFVGLEPQMKINLTWNDAFGLTLKASSHTFYMDLACCLWNLAAFESLMGARLDRTNEEGLKAANKHFQQAAGYLEYIRQQVLPHLPNLGSFPCMSEDGLNMVKNLMLAQGQLCYYEKAVKDKKRDPAAMKASIIAKLAKQTSAFYHTTSISCKVGVLGSMLDISWFAVTDFQSKIFQGAAEYWQAHASKEAAQAVGSGYGEQVTRFNRADTAVGLALAQSAKFNIADSLLFGANGLRAAIQQHRQTAEHDLRTVYMESVPSDNSLAEVGCVSMVRPLDVPEPSGTPSGLLFRYVLPQHVRVANAKFKEEISATYNSTNTTAEAATNAARTALSAKGLPGSLEAAKTEDVLPPSLWVKVQRVQAMGGPARLNSMFEDLKAAARRTLQSMATIEECLDREERTDDDFRKLNPDFPGTTSRVLSGDVRANNVRMREAYRNAQASDKQIETDMTSETTQGQLSIVSKSKEDLLKMFPRDTPNLLDYDESLDKRAEDPEITHLEEKLQELAALIETRTQEVAELQKVVALDVTDLANAALSKSQDISAIHAKHLQEAQDLQMRVVQGVSKQEALLKEIMDLNDAFCKHRLTNPLAVERNKVIQQVEQAVAKFSLIHSQITAGITFYSSLQSKLTTLTQTADDLAYTQQWQRQDYGAQKSSEIERSTQEMADRDFALKLSNELIAAAQAPPPPAGSVAGGPVSMTGFSAAQPSVPSQPQQSQYPPQQQPYPQYPGGALPAMVPTPAPQGGYPAPAPAPMAAAQPKPSEIVYGTPVSGPPPHLVPLGQGPAAVPGGPTSAPNATPYSAPTTGYPASYPPQYQQYSAAQAPAPAAAPQNPAYNPAYNPNLYGAAQPPGVPQQPQQQAYNSAAPAPTSYSAYPAMPALGQQPGYQYNSNSYSTVPGPHAQQALPQQQGVPQMQPHQAPQPLNPAELHAKTMRLCEMGFPSDQAQAALLANGGNEEAALNSLLAGPSGPPPPAGGAVAGAPVAAAAPGSGAATGAAPEKPAKPSGLFGRMWGSNK